MSLTQTLLNKIGKLPVAPKPTIIVMPVGEAPDGALMNYTHNVKDKPKLTKLGVASYTTKDGRSEPIDDDAGEVIAVRTTSSNNDSNTVLLKSSELVVVYLTHVQVIEMLARESDA